MNCGILHDLEMNATALVFKPSYVKAEPPASYIGHILRVFFKILMDFHPLAYYVLRSVF